LRKLAGSDFIVKGQTSTIFWKTDKGERKYLRPDILIETNGTTYILDTKWKVPKDNMPSDEDLRQMFAYNKMHLAKHSLLVYPSNKAHTYAGEFHNQNGEYCGMAFNPVADESGKLSKLPFEELRNILATESINNYNGQIHP
jgi:5-methylcytosine-specific restriction enzyme subunit McrC